MANKRRRKKRAGGRQGRGEDVATDELSEPAEGKSAVSEWAVAVVLLLVAAYLWIFYSAPAGGQWKFDDGQPFARWHLLLVICNPDIVPGKWFPQVADFSILDRLPLLALAGSMLAVAGLAGWLVLEVLGVAERLTQWERVVFSLGLGLQISSLYTLAVGLAGGLASRWPFLAAGAAVIVAAAVVRRRRAAVSTDKGSKTILPAADTPGEARWLGPGFLWCLLPYLFVILWASTMPPWDFDVREYHLQVPKEWYQEGRVTFLPHNIYGNMPLGAEMHAATAMALWGDWWYGALVGKVIMGVFTPLAALGVLAAGRRFFSPTAGVVAAAICLSIPWLTKTAATGFNEGALAFYLLAAVYTLMLATRDSRPAWPLLAGLFVGAALSCKYTAALFVALPLFLWVWVGPALAARLPSGWMEDKESSGGKDASGPRPGLAWQAAGLLLLAILVSGGPWLVKNAVLAGNPVYPLLYGALDGKTRTPEKDAQWRSAHAPPGETTAERYGPAALAGGAAVPLWRAEWTSPILVPLALVSLLIHRHRRKVLALWALLLAIGLAWWLATHRIERFLVPALPVAALLAGVGATWQTTRLWRHAIIGLLFWTLVLNFFLCGSQVMKIDPRFFYSLESLRSDEVSSTPDHQQLEQLVPEGKRVLLVGDAQPFDLKVPVLYNTCFDDCLLETLLAGLSPTEQRAALVEADISHVYVDWSEIARYRSAGNYGFTDYVQPELLEKLVAEGVLEPPNQPYPQSQIFAVAGDTGG